MGGGLPIVKQQHPNLGRALHRRLRYYHSHSHTHPAAYLHPADRHAVPNLDALPNTHYLVLRRLPEPANKHALPHKYAIRD